MASTIPLPLSARLAYALPQTLHLSIHHIVSEPFSCPALFSAPPNEAPESTVCESHFLSASISRNGEPLQVFAIEVLVYTTDTLTTLFVSKADSTGYLKLLNLAKDTPSPIKAVLSTFLEFLVEIKRRKDARIVLSLFARAQNQYLFPGSIENTEKHVLDDRALIKWWCRVVNPILDIYAPFATLPLPHAESDSTLKTSEPEFRARAHLVVPGCDAYETRAYFPRRASLAFETASPWTAGDPLEKLGKPSGLPPRCYIPRFPDDPKARFVIDLDDELPKPPTESQDVPLTDSQTGRWRSVRSLTQFWDFMSFRQECAAGRLVGFLWLVFEPSALTGQPQKANPGLDNIANVPEESQEEPLEEPQLPTPQDSQHQGVGAKLAMSEVPSSPFLQPLPETLLSPISSSQPQTQVETAGSLSKKEDTADIPTSVASPPTKAPGNTPPGAVLLNEPAYKRVMEILERTDYATMDLALGSTKTFLSSVAEEISIEGWDWGYEVIGELSELRPPASDSSRSEESAKGAKSITNGVTHEMSSSQVQMLGASLIRKKKRPVDNGGDGVDQLEMKSDESRVLGVGVVRKKPKV
ncbi:hypothetical protein MMC10_000993 [Thelotrema lepadinum]|nr:hypothetical protein [Thelotrema lepadinum]